MGIYSMWLHLY